MLGRCRRLLFSSGNEASPNRRRAHSEPWKLFPTRVAPGGQGARRGVRGHGGARARVWRASLPAREAARAPVHYCGHRREVMNVRPHLQGSTHVSPRVRPAVRGVYAARPAAAGGRRAELAHLGTGPTPGHLSPELAHLSLCTPGNVRVCTHLRAHSGLWTICTCARCGILASLGIFLHPYNNPPLFFPSW